MKQRRFQTYAVGIGENGVITKIYVDELSRNQLLDSVRVFLGDASDELLREFMKDMIDEAGERNEAAMEPV